MENYLTVNDSENFKFNFLDKVYSFVNHKNIDLLIEEYITENEMREGAKFWQNFSSLKEIIDDFKHFVEFADECEWYYEE
jgi:hypothetical protein